MDAVNSENERKKILALKVFCISEADRKRIYNALPKDVVVELKSLVLEIKQMGVHPEVAREFVWGKEEVAESSTGTVGWSGFVSLLEASEAPGERVPTSLIGLLKNKTGVELGG